MSASKENVHREYRSESDASMSLKLANAVGVGASGVDVFSGAEDDSSRRDSLSAVMTGASAATTAATQIRTLVAICVYNILCTVRTRWPVLRGAPGVKQTASSCAAVVLLLIEGTVGVACGFFLVARRRRRDEKSNASWQQKNFSNRNRAGRRYGQSCTLETSHEEEVKELVPCSRYERRRRGSRGGRRSTQQC